MSVVTASILDLPYQLDGCHVLMEEISRDSKIVVPYPWRQTKPIVDVLELEEAQEELVGAVHATDALSHRQGVQVFHGEREDHSVQRSLSRSRIRIYFGHA